MTLFWKAPDDGNDEIIEYILEYREKIITKWTQITQITDTSYKVEKLKSDTEYVFRVSARNNIGAGPPSPNSDFIRIIPSFDKEKPTIIEPLVDKTIGLNEKLILTSVIGGEPTPTITWYKNQKEITETEQITYENRVTKLIVKETTTDTHGEYKCIAVNDVGIAETKCQVIVQEKPKIVIEEKQINQKQRKGALYKIVAVVSGFPEPEIIWQHNETIVESDETRIQIKREQNLVTFEISNVERNDSGKYTVIARNVAGETSVELKLKVIDKPEKPTALDIVEVKKDSVVIGMLYLNVRLFLFKFRILNYYDFFSRMVTTN